MAVAYIRENHPRLAGLPFRQRRGRPAARLADAAHLARAPLLRRPHHQDRGPAPAPPRRRPRGRDRHRQRPRLSRRLGPAHAVRLFRAARLSARPGRSPHRPGGGARRRRASALRARQETGAGGDGVPGAARAAALRARAGGRARPGRRRARPPRHALGRGPAGDPRLQQRRPDLGLRRAAPASSRFAACLPGPTRSPPSGSTTLGPAPFTCGTNGERRIARPRTSSRAMRAVGDASPLFPVERRDGRRRGSRARPRRAASLPDAAPRRAGKRAGVRRLRGASRSSVQPGLTERSNVLLRWTTRTLTTACQLHDVLFARSADGPFEPVNARPLLSSAFLHGRERGPGFYVVRTRDLGGLLFAHSGPIEAPA